MGYLGKKEREALDKNLFGDPDRLLFPIQSADDIKTAAETVDLVSNAPVIKQNITRIAKEKGYELPQGWESVSESVAPLEFAIFGEPEQKAVIDNDLGPVIIKTGKIFEANNYPDKKYGMTPEEMLLATKDFTPVGLNDSHNNASLLKGKWGQLRNIKVADNGWDLTGEVAVPVWLDTAMKGEPIKVSAEWNRDTKKLEKLAYVTNPRVSDAAIYAAFTANEIAEDDEMKDIMTKWFEQRLAAVDSKAPDKASGKTAPKTTKSDGDITKGKTIMGYLADFKTKISEALKGLPDEDPKAIELSDDEVEDQEDKGKKDDKVTKLSADTKKKKEDEKVEDKVEAKKEVTIVMSDEDKKEMKALRDQISVLENDKLVAEATKFADDIVAAELAYPAEKSAMIANFIQAARDDRSNEVKVKFSIGRDANGTEQVVEGSRLDSLKALYAVRRPHNLTKETLAAFGAGVLAPERTEDGDEAARKRAEEYADQFNRRLQKSAATAKR